MQCMNKDSSKGRLEKVCVDGGMTRNTFLMQLLANMIGIPVGASLAQSRHIPVTSCCTVVF